MTDGAYTYWLDDCYSVDGEGLRAYARATRSPHVPYAMSRIIPRDTPVPPLIVADPVFKVAARLLAEQIEDFNVGRLLHVSQTVRQLEPIHIGDVASLGARIADRVTRAGIDLFTVECAIRVGGETRIETSSVVAYSGGEDVNTELVDAASRGIVMHGAVL
ncbi:MULTISPECIES: MaoC family dehydratase N-terminal domain-containing protein [Tsukamurella]|uniref:MaoC family dehydratase n=2 Tax=Tsukamurella TaxID=2060 RepID=A0A5C5S1Z1_9ACTN|nr:MULTISPECIES: MaoC family dehydratase N-terminal domain-containing protein [Tsukamurella]NMD54171.1 MaoC family dehydratase [Tsukamurella columbiensis]TWS28301.1 MaoC family dehydratase [Tsukamurella conjunctivitidis]